MKTIALLATVLISLVSCASHNENMQTYRYRVPPTYGSERIKDQAGDLVGLRKVSIQGLMESNGVEFAEGSSVIYDPSEPAVTVTNTPNQIKAVDAYMEATFDRPVDKRRMNRN
ncbi:hypothetical protein HZ994_11235 [Akkermansiaceae bacterium]|nr:hypothetical protein HZ994_11235 [Akkermansiaceae bacterium]